MNSIKKSQLDSLVNVIVKSLLNEISDRVSVAPLKLQQMVQPLETGIKKLFPNSSVIVEYSTNLMDCVTIHFALEPESEWPNGIYHNASHINLMINEKSGKQREGDSGLYEVEAGSMWKLPKFRKKTGNSNAIVNHIIKYFTSIYETVHAPTETPVENPKETIEQPVTASPNPVSEESGTVAVAPANSPVQTRPKVMEGDEADAVNDMWAGSDDDLKGHDITPSPKQPTKSKLPSGIKMKTSGQQCFVYVKSGRLAGRSVSAVKRDGLYYYLNPDTGRDECIGSSLSISEPAPKKLNEGTEGATPADAQMAHTIATQLWGTEVKNLIYHSSRDGVMYFRVDTGSTYYRWICKSRDSWFYKDTTSPRAKFQPYVMAEDTVTGDVAGYNVPGAFSKRGGSERGVQGSEKLGFTLTPQGKQDFKTSADKLIE